MPGQGTITITPDPIARNQPAVILSLVGSGTLWVQGVSVFVPSGVVGVAVSLAVVLDSAHALLTLVVGASVGVCTITQGLDSGTFNIISAASPWMGRNMMTGAG